MLLSPFVRISDAPIFVLTGRRFLLESRERPYFACIFALPGNIASTLISQRELTPL